MNPLPLGTHYHARGMDQIARANTLDDLVRRQRKQIKTAVWFPIWVVACGGGFLWLIASVCDYLGVK